MKNNTQRFWSYVNCHLIINFDFVFYYKSRQSNSNFEIVEPEKKGIFLQGKKLSLKILKIHNQIFSLYFITAAYII